MMVGPNLYIVTGASHGIGSAIAGLLLARPATQLLVIARHTSQELNTVAEKHGCVLEQWDMDLLESMQVAQRLGRWLDAWSSRYLRDSGEKGQLCLINNAALLPSRIAPLFETDAATIDSVLRVNLHAPMLLTAQFLRSTHALAETSGVTRKVLNMSSGLARVAMAPMSPYSAAKAGIDQFTLCLAKEEAGKRFGARVCALVPGVVDTDMQRQMRNTSEQDFPDAKAFQFLHAAGRLLPAPTAARMVLDLLDSPDFGVEPLTALRQRPSARQG